MLQPCLARTCKISDSPLTFRRWAYEVDRQRQLIDRRLGQAVVAEPIEESEIGLERGKPNAKGGYSSVPRMEV